MSDPRLALHSPAATATALPPDDPPGTRSGSQGFRDPPKAQFSQDEPRANSSIRVLPSTIAPASSSRFTHVAVKGER